MKKKKRFEYKLFLEENNLILNSLIFIVLNLFWIIKIKIEEMEGQFIIPIARSDGKKFKL
jgi:hypothetical protein